MRYNIIIVSLLFLLALTPTQAQDKSIEVVASTTIIADIAQNVGGDFINITALVPPDTDVHAFEPIPSDLRSIESADLILINGAGLEAFLGGILSDVPAEKIITVSNGINVLAFNDPDKEYLGVLGQDVTCDDNLELYEDTQQDDENEDEHAHGSCDPHFWLDPMNVIQMTQNIADTFANFDPQHADTYQSNADTYIKQLKDLDGEIRDLLSSIPPEKRMIVTNHEFLAYFAHAYNFEIVANVIPSVSTLAEPSPRELAALISTIEEKQIPAIFVEVSETGRLAQVVADETGNTVKIAELYSASLSKQNEPASTYLDYMRFNAETILNALTAT